MIPLIVVIDEKGLFPVSFTKRISVLFQLHYSLNLDRVSIPMTSIGNQELPYDELGYGMLIDLLQELQRGVIRKPDHFNNLHFLLLLLYDAHGSPRDRYPLWRWYHRIKKKFLTAKHLTIDTDNSRQHILTALEDLVENNPTISNLVEESVQVEDHYLHSSIYGLFKAYTPIHTYLYLEELEKPIINENPKIFQLFQTAIMKVYRNEFSDLIHFSIAHKKTHLLQKIFDDKVNWLDISMNLTTRRGWLPLHYASYVGDREIVKSICESLTSPTLPVHFDTISLLIPSFKQNQW